MSIKRIFKGPITKSGKVKYKLRYMFQKVYLAIYWETRGDEIWFTIDEVYETRYDCRTMPEEVRLLKLLIF